MSILSDKNKFRAAAIAIHKNARDKGFWDYERNFGEAIALVHSELSEADENSYAASDKIPCFSVVEEEIADVIIRLCDMLVGFCEEDQFEWIVNSINFNSPPQDHHTVEGRDFSRAFLDIHKALSLLLESHRKHGASHTDKEWVELFSLIIKNKSYFSITGGLEVAMEEKIAYNLGRPKMHGKAY